MDIESALVNFLKSSPEVTAIIGAGDLARIYPEVAPQSVTDPHITYQVISWPKWGHLAGQNAGCNPRIQLDCWVSAGVGIKRSYELVKDLANAVRNARGGQPQGRKLDGFAGQMSGMRIHCVRIEDRRGDPVPPQHGEETPWRRWSMDLIVSHDEEPLEG